MSSHCHLHIVTTLSRFLFGAGAPDDNRIGQLERIGPFVPARLFEAAIAVRIKHDVVVAALGIVEFGAAIGINSNSAVVFSVTQGACGSICEKSSNRGFDEDAYLKGCDQSPDPIMPSTSKGLGDHRSAEMPIEQIGGFPV
jgi:hypothetical protein